MGLFSKKPSAVSKSSDAAMLAELALNSIHEGVIIINKGGKIRFINPAAMTMTGCVNAEVALGFDYGMIVKLVDKENAPIPDEQNKLLAAVQKNEAFESREYALASTTQVGRIIPVALILTPTGDVNGNKILTMRDIENELKEEGEQAEFISTASHEMRTPVASIEGYLGLALNPQTATIDDRARQYIDAAHSSSQHLGRLLQDLLDVTKLDDGKLKPQTRPIDLNITLKEFSRELLKKIQDKKLSFSFGKGPSTGGVKRLEQTVYTIADIDFLREVFVNLVENAIKYTPEGGLISVDIQGDGDRAIFTVSDTGIGIEQSDLQHIFQKFYRADNSQTRTIGGTGLGLYLVKQRVEAMNGRVWAESAFGHGSTFFVSLPRLSSSDFEKSMLAFENQQAAQAFAENLEKSDALSKAQVMQLPQAPTVQGLMPPQPEVPQQPVVQPVTLYQRPDATPAPQMQVMNAMQPQPVTTPTPIMARTAQPQIAQPAPAQPAPQPVVQPAPQPTPQPAPQAQPAPAQPAPQPQPTPVVPAAQPVEQPQPTVQIPAPQPAPQPVAQPVPQPTPQPTQPAPQPVAATASPPTAPPVPQPQGTVQN